MHVERNTEERSYIHCCNGKAIRITYSECVFVALSIQYALSMRGIVVFGLSDSTLIFFTLSHKRHDFQQT
jgi:hypothetical protein